MKKAVVIISVVFVTFSLTMGAFFGGFLVGRVTGASKITEGQFLPTPEQMKDIGSKSNPELPGSDSETSSGSGNTTNGFDYKLLEEVLTLLNEEFYGEMPDEQTLAHGAIRGLLFTLDDPYTSFLEPQIATILNEDASGSFEGIGATVRIREDGFLEIVRPLPGHPAEEAGLKAGDLILSVDGESIVGMGLYEAISLIRGPAGSEVTLEVARSGESETFMVDIVRASIEMPIVEHEMLDDGVAYLRLSEFDANARSALEESLQELFEENPQGLVFDLRDNPGGWLEQAIRVSDLFLDEGLVAVKRDSSGNEEVYGSRAGDIGEDIPMVVLVNGGSASASEIVAGALRDRERAILIGEQTLGKGSVQNPHNLSDGSRLNVTIAHWYTPGNHNIHGEGLDPDIEVPVPDDTPVTEDPQLDKAIEYLLENE